MSCVSPLPGSPPNALDQTYPQQKQKYHEKLSTSLIYGAFKSVTTIVVKCYRYVQSTSSDSLSICSDQIDGRHEQEKEFTMTAKEMEELKDAMQTFLRCQRPMKTMEEIRASPFQSNFTHNSITRINHCEQSETWDCGVACLLMILRWLNDLDLSLTGSLQPDNEVCIDFDQSCPLSEAEIDEKKWMLETLGTESIWTIDLIFLLDKLILRKKRKKNREGRGTADASYLFCSSNLGVNESYRGFNFYKQTFREDEDRVKKLFRMTCDSGFSLVRTFYLDLNFVLYLVTRENCVAIVLLDDNLLGNGMFSSNKELKLFTGHFVILCGISFNKADITQAEAYGVGKGSRYCMVLKNPGNSQATVFVTPLQFERAWRAEGTDHDIVFINAHTSIRRNLKNICNERRVCNFY